MADAGSTDPILYTYDPRAAAMEQRRERGPSLGVGSGGGGGPTTVIPPPIDATTTYFKMRAHNTLSAVVTWVVTGEADTTGAQYTGGNTPLTDFSVAAAWSA